MSTVIALAALLAAAAPPRTLAARGTWAAFDRGVRAVEEHGLAGPVERWRELRDLIREEVMTRGVDADRGCFVQHYDTDEVDASLLMLPVVGFVAGDDPVMLGMRFCEPAKIAELGAAKWLHAHACCDRDVHQIFVVGA